MKLLGRSSSAAGSEPGEVRRVTGTPTGAPVVADDVTPVPTRLARLAKVVDGSRRRSDRDIRKILQILGAITIGFGFVCIVLGWYGASHSPYLYQEIPYLISGGLLGVALVIAGGVLVRTAWSLRQVEEDRRNAVAIVRSMDRLERVLQAFVDANSSDEARQEGLSQWK